MDFMKVIGKGRLTNNPVHNEKFGVTNFGVAFNIFNKKNKSTIFVDCEAWDRPSKFIFQYFKKGNEIMVDGYLFMEEWTGENGNKFTRMKCRVLQANFCSNGKRAEIDSRDNTPVSPSAHEEDFPIDGQISEDGANLFK